MKAILTYIFIALTMALILLFCFIVGILILYLCEELRYAVSRIKRTIKESLWDLEWKLNHR